MNAGGVTTVKNGSGLVAILSPDLRDGVMTLEDVVNAQASESSQGVKANE